MNRESRIVIIGAGIGGLSTAIALHQRGFRTISIYERRALQQSPGAGFVLWANAGRVLDKLGILPDVRYFGGTLDHMQRWTDDGEFLGAVDIRKIDEEIGCTSYAVSKAEFQGLLEKKIAERRIPLNRTSGVKAIEDTDSGNACLRLEDNARIEADIIIGADGRMSSVARTYIHGNNRPVYQNYVNWVGVLDCSDTLSPGRNVLDYWGCGKRFGIVPIDKRKVYWAGCEALPLNSSNTEATNKKELLKIFKKFPPLVQRIIEETEDTRINRIPIFDHDPDQRWFRNNVCLVGDAAHASLPTSGQGACQAIEDAWHLSKQLSNFDSLEKAFETYQTIRYKKTTAITLAGREFAKVLFTIDKDYCAERNRKAKLTDYDKAADGMIGLWSAGLTE